MKKTKLTTASLLVAATTALAATLEWPHSPPEDRVTHYWLEHRETTASDWVRVEVPATSNRVTIPESAFGRWFRIAAVNDFGAGDWSEPQKLPERIAGIRLIVEIVP